MRFFQAIKDYGYGLYQRFINAARPDQGMITVGIAGGTYTAIRASLTAVGLNVPLIGGVTLGAVASRFFLGGLVGGIASATYGNRYGQIVDALKPTENDLNNQAFMMRTMPVICGAAAEALIYAIPVVGGNPIFITLRVLSTTELHLLTVLNGIFVGGTLGYRGGKFVDWLTNGKLVADFGLFSGYKFVKNKLTAASETTPLLTAASPT